MIGLTASAALAATLVELITKLTSYYVHERIWNEIKWGKKLKKEQGCCIWMTGLSGSGKTTIAKQLVDELEKRLKRVEYLDGDVVRESFCADLGFSKEDRDENIRRVSFVSSYLSKHSYVICAFISPYKAARLKAQQMNNNFIEVFVDAPLSVCEKRDVKGLYKKARSGEIKGFTGIDDPYEAPSHPDIHIKTDEQTVEESVQTILDYLEKRNLL